MFPSVSSETELVDLAMCLVLVEFFRLASVFWSFRLRFVWGCLGETISRSRKEMAHNFGIISSKNFNFLENQDEKNIPQWRINFVVKEFIWNETEQIDKLQSARTMKNSTLESRGFQLVYLNRPPFVTNQRALNSPNLLCGHLRNANKENWNGWAICRRTKRSPMCTLLTYVAPHTGCSTNFDRVNKFQTEISIGFSKKNWKNHWQGASRLGFSPNSVPRLESR